jgi:hypothetical protein
MTDHTDNDVTRPIPILIDRAVELLAPRDEVARIILRAAVIAAADVTHETGCPDTFVALLVDTVRKAFARAPVAARGSAERPCEYCGNETTGSTVDHKGFMRCNSCGEPSP